MTQPIKPPAVKSPGAIFLTEQARREALRVAHDFTASEEEHEAAVATLTLIARQTLLRSPVSA